MGKVNISTQKDKNREPEMNMKRRRFSNIKLAKFATMSFSVKEKTPKTLLWPSSS